MKNIWRIALLGYLFGMCTLFVCVIAVMAGMVQDMGIGLLALPIVCPILLIFFRHVSKFAFEDALYGQGAFARWSVLGALAGVFYTIKIILEERTTHGGIYGMGLLVLSLFAFWLIFFYKQRELK